MKRSIIAEAPLEAVTMPVKLKVEREIEEQ